MNTDTSLSRTKATGGPLSPTPPFPHLAQDRGQDEKVDLDGEQNDAKRFEEQVIDRQGDPQEQKEAIDPDGHAEQCIARTRRLVGKGFVPPEQHASQPIAGVGVGATFQVGHADQIGEQEIGVEAHQGIEVDQQAEQP